MGTKWLPESSSRTPINPRFAYALFRNARFDEDTIVSSSIPVIYPCEHIRSTQDGRDPLEERENTFLRDEKLIIRATK